MRRSCAPSVRKAEKRRSEDNGPIISTKITAQSKKEPSNEFGTKRLKGNKLVFNILWRDHSKKKHKTWKGNGILDVQLDKHRAVLLDDTGKYMGSTDKFRVTDLQEGFQMCISDKEIECLDQIGNQNDYWATRKMLMENRAWGNEEWTPPEEKKKIKSEATSFILQPSIHLNAQLQRRRSKCYNSPVIISRMSDVNSQNQGNSHENMKQISESLANKLRPHQWEGVMFLYSCLITQRDLACENYGCILADEMGLGKTLQVLTVANMLLRQNTNRTVHRVLIVTPRSLIGNWNNEIYKWLHAERMYGFTVDGSCTTNNRKLSAYAKQQHVPFVIASYETLVSQIQDFQALNFDLIICDEGHRLKNTETKTYKSLRELNIKRCILLTGTPVQNVLSEFYALADFVRPGIFGSRSKFRQHFEVPIEMGQSSSATEEEKYLGTERAEELKEISSTFLIRRLQDVNQKFLPKKWEYICFLKPSKLQHILLRKALHLYEDRKDLSSQDLTPLEMIAVLRKICNHPYLLKRTKKDNMLTTALSRYMKDMQRMDPTDSTKLSFVQNLLQRVVLKQWEKIVLVSYHTKTLNVLQELCDYHSLNYLRLDGSTSTAERNGIISKFNAEPSQSVDEAYILLLSAKAGGVGLNLIGASRLVLFDIDWNPANDAQALSRIWREGQQKDVHIYRLVTAGTIEEKIFQRQMAKTNLGDFLIPTDTKSNSTSMKFSTEELKDLFYLQYDYNFCDTHQSLKCECIGDGQNLIACKEQKMENKQINELNQWKHWQPDYHEYLMQEACLSDAKEDLIYLFTNETVNKDTENK